MPSIRDGKIACATMWAAVARTDADGTNRTTVVPQSGEGSLYTWLCGDSG
ncbi:MULTISPECIES: hypothetical protein [unclassified Streptomyces]|nr:MULTISPECIES: hypothetical protein [unclassified Streptomyces]